MSRRFRSPRTRDLLALLLLAALATSNASSFADEELFVNGFETGDTSAWSSTVDPPPPPPALPSRAAVLGCSNTGQHVAGYRLLSTAPRLINEGSLGGASLMVWGRTLNPDAWPWVVVRNSAPEEGYDGAWFQICLSAAESPDESVTALHQSDVQFAVDRLVSDYGIEPQDIYVSALQDYPEGHLCPTAGAHSVAASNAIADWAVAELGLSRGPITSVSFSGIDPDQCHLNLLGQQEVGGQLVDFFDDP